MRVEADDIDQPLAGATVLEISSRPAGAYCGLLLAQLGADVTRVDLPIAGDVRDEHRADYEAALGRGKKLVPTDSPELSRLAAGVDLIVSDSLHDDALDGAAKELAEQLAAQAGEHTQVVDIAGHLENDGRGAEVATSSLTVSARAGMSWALGHPGMEPLTLPVDIPDHLLGAEATGLAALALLTADAGSDRSRQWSVAGTDTLAYYVGQICANFIPYERPWHRDGARASMSGGSYPAAMFRCTDGHVSIMCRTSREWHALLRAMGDPDWSSQDHFRDPRVVARHHADEADRHLKAWVGEHTCAEMFSLGTTFAFPIAPVLTVADSLNLEQFAERGFVAPDARIGGLRLPGRPWRFSGSAATTGSEEPAQSTAPAVPTEQTRPWSGSGDPSDGPLAGLRVLDLSWVWSGPMVTAALRDLGAEVIKIENRQRADPARLRGRAIRGGQPVEGPELEVTPYFNQMNRGKQSVAIDIATEQGRDLILDLVEQCDVVVENMRPGALERRGLSYDQLAARNPGVVMLSMSLMGQTGPMRGVGGYAPVMSGLAGLDSLVGYSSDDLIGLYNPALGDPNGAAHAMAALLATLVRRQRTGRGAWIDLAQVEALLAVQPGPIIEAQRLGRNVVRANGHSRWWPHGTFRTAGADSWLTVSARTDAERARLAEVLGAEPDTTPDILTTAVAAWAATRCSDDAADILNLAGIPASTVCTFEQLVESEWAKRQLFTEIAHPYLGLQKLFSLPWKRSMQGFPARSCAPLLGADSDTVLERLLGLDATARADLRAAGAVE